MRPSASGAIDTRPPVTSCGPPLTTESRGPNRPGRPPSPVTWVRTRRRRPVVACASSQAASVPIASTTVPPAGTVRAVRAPRTRRGRAHRTAHAARTRRRHNRAPGRSSGRLQPLAAEQHAADRVANGRLRQLVPRRQRGQPHALPGTIVVVLALVAPSARGGVPIRAGPPAGSRPDRGGGMNSLVIGAATGCPSRGRGAAVAR